MRQKRSCVLSVGSKNAIYLSILDVIKFDVFIVLRYNLLC